MKISISLFNVDLFDRIFDIRMQILETELIILEFFIDYDTLTIVF